MRRRLMRMVMMGWAICWVAGASGTAYGEGAISAATVSTAMVKTEIFFGSDLPGELEISRAEWLDFLDKVITPHFPQGLTVFDAFGQMQHADGRIEKQSTWVVAIAHPQDPKIDQAASDVIAAFRKQFEGAQAVLLNSPVSSAQFFAD